LSENSQVANTTAPPSARTDLITGAVFLAFGLAIVDQSLRMPDFTDVGGSGYTAPGLVPGFYGVILFILGLSLAIRSVLRGAFKPGGGKPAGFENLPPISLSRLAIAAALCVFFSLVLIGHMPFAAAVAIFVFAFTAIFEWQPRQAVALRLRHLATAAILAVAVGAGVLGVFQYVFLVRLP
jgi:hypothetical protein